ncbi:MAG TPA: hypothetical protein PKV19_07625, partial [Anaerolineales bacterium]|nr:hypothetical protein [Anaerolineales bacterium]
RYASQVGFQRFPPTFCLLCHLRHFQPFYMFLPPFSDNMIGQFLFAEIVDSVSPRMYNTVR